MAPTDHAAALRFTYPGDDASVLFDNVTDQAGLTLDKENGIVTGYSDVKSGLSTGATRLFVYGDVRQARDRGLVSRSEGPPAVQGRRPDRHPAPGDLADQRRPGEGQPPPGDPGGHVLRGREEARPAAVGPAARQGGGRGRDTGPADDAVLQPVPAVPVPELRFREGRRASTSTPRPSPPCRTRTPRRTPARRSSTARCTSTTASGTPTARPGRPTPSSRPAGRASWSTGSCSSTRTAAGPRAGPPPATRTS